MKKAFSENRHLSSAINCSNILGTWTFIFPENLQTKLTIYRKIITGYFCLYLLLIYIKTIILLINNIRDEEVQDAIAKIFVYNIYLMKYQILKSTPVEDLLCNIVKREQDIFNGKIKAIIRIYTNYNIKSTYSKICLFTMIVLNGLMNLYPILKKPVETLHNNTTIFTKQFPVPLWFPFDEQKYYPWAFASQLPPSFIGVLMLQSTDMSLITLILFTVGQLKICNYILKNFGIFSGQIQKQLGVSSDEASRVCIRECVILHQDIIEYVKKFNDNFNLVFLIEFVLSSICLAIFIVRAVLEEQGDFHTYLCLLYFIAFSMRLFVYNWTANEIICYSTQISSSIWESNWFEQPIDVKKSMLMMMMRSQKQLQVEIGGFKNMSVDTFLTILKATYSYLSVINKKS